MFTISVPDLACLVLLLDDMLGYCANVHAISCLMFTNMVPYLACLVLLLGDILADRNREILEMGLNAMGLWVDWKVIVV